MKRLLIDMAKAVLRDMCIGLTKEAALDFLYELKYEIIEGVRFELFSEVKQKMLDVCFEFFVGKHIRRLNSLYSMIGTRMDLDDIDLSTSYEHLYENHMKKDEEYSSEEDEEYFESLKSLYMDAEFWYKPSEDDDEYEDEYEDDGILRCDFKEYTDHLGRATKIIHA